MYDGGFMSPMQRCFSDLVCQPSVTSYVINALCLATLHAWTLEYQHMMDALRLRRQKANGQLEKTAGSPSQQGSGGCQRYTAIYAVETWNRQGSCHGANRLLWLSTARLVDDKLLSMLAPMGSSLGAALTRSKPRLGGWSKRYKSHARRHVG